MMLYRVLEPEVMDDPVEARLYNEMDHSGVNRIFVEDMLALGSIEGRLLDVGTGTAHIPIEICNRVEECEIMACDLAVSMLDIARINVALAGFEHRIRLYHTDAKTLDCEEGIFDWVISNSLIHHVPRPAPVFGHLLRMLKPGGRLFVRDLLRPACESEIERLVQIYTGNEALPSQQLFRQSLAAALSLEEVRDMIRPLGISADSVQATSDRHWTMTSVLAI